MLESIKKMLNAFEQENILYCHWKSNQHLQESLNGDTDLDVLFSHEQRSQLEAVLGGCGLKRFRATPLMQYNAIEDYIGFDEKAARIWHLHTHYRMTLGEKHLKGYTVTAWEPYILKHRILAEDGIYTSSPEVELVLFLCRNALKLRFRDIGKKIGKGDLKEYHWMLERIDSSVFAQCAEEMIGGEGVKLVLPLLDGKLKSKSQLRPLKRYLRRKLKYCSGFSRLGSFWMRTKRELYWLCGGIKRRLGWNSSKPYRRVSPSGGTVVAILGCDGAGKSTSLKYVRKEFGKKIDVKSIYLGSGDGSSSLLRRPMKSVAKKVGGKGVGRSAKKEMEGKGSISLKTRLYNIAKLYWAISLAKEKKSKLKQITKARNNGMLVLCDRYPQTVVPGYSDGPLLDRYITRKGLKGCISRWERRIYESFSVNKPDLAIKLTVPSDVAISRKPEMTVEEIERKKEAVRQIDCAERSVEIDTSCTKEESLSKIMTEIWRII